MKFAGKAVIVTGGGSGIGREIALAFAREGADIAVNDRDAAGAVATAAVITKEFRRRALPLPGDVSRAEDVDKLVESTLQELGKVDILVNNAGVGQEMLPTIEQSVKKWELVIGVHLKGTYLCSRRVGQWMVPQKSGVIINIASVVALGGFPMRTAYGPAKAGIVNLTRSLAVEWAEHGIRVNAIAPGYIETRLVLNAEKAGALDMGPILRRTPLGRLGKPDDVAKAAVFLASDDAAYITGVTLPVDGGWSAYHYT
ncbi:MAG: glucose 1-dehydrogenase [Chloroflexota bacterium]